MLVRFALPPCVESPLSRRDPRWRLFCLLAILIGLGFLRQWPTVLLGSFFAFFLAWYANMPWKWFTPRLSALAIMLALFVAPMPIFSPLPWTESLLTAGVILIKALSLLTIGSVLLITAPFDTTLRAAHALYLPGLLVQLALLSYRYLFVLGDELARLRIALRVRGFRNRPNLHSYRTVASATGTLFVRGQERADRVAAAMRCRGYDGELRSLLVFQTTWIDVVFTALVLGCTIALCVLDRTVFSS